MTTVLDEAAVVDGLPPVRRVAAAEVAERARAAPTFVALDDDPTGTQTVADVPVVTAWGADDLRWALAQGSTGFFVLTNTRSLGPAAAAARTEEVVTALATAARLSGASLSIASRGDSTLRGHFPTETDAIAAALEHPVDGVVLVPAYIEGGRLTVHSLHWARTPAGLVPVGESEYAADATFGYRSSDLAEWIEEKTSGRRRAADVLRITVDDIRLGGTGRVAELLSSLRGGRPAVVDATCDDDLRVLALAAMAAEERGTSLLYRIGPSFVRARLGQEARPPLAGASLRAIVGRAGGRAGGLVVAGSHVGLTTRQLAHLEATRPTATAELDVPALLDSADPAAITAAVADEVALGLARGTVVLRTSRALVRSDDPDLNLAVARRVSQAVVDVVRAVVAQARPSWIVAKGGITSSDLATHALGIRRAWARGTLLPGIVSLWEPDGDPAVRVPFAVFAGNVGDETSLTAVVSALEEAAA